MDMGTTSGSTYKNFKVIPKKKQLRRFEDEGKPIVAQSTYMKNFPNWKNGQGDIFHEKHPQYPFYSLPFKGDSSYAMNHNETQQRKLREHNQMLRQIGQERGRSSSNVISLKAYKPLAFESETTNQKNYKGFKLLSRPKVQTQ